MLKSTLTLVTTATALLGFAVQADTINDANVKLLQAGDTATVAKIPDGIYLRNENDPDDTIWERLPQYRVSMLPAPAVHESVELRVNYDAPETFLYFTPARTSDRVYMRLRWVDETRDQTTGFDSFRDAVAVQFSLGGDETSYLMGNGPLNAVNIWYWRSDDDTIQNLAAGGPGSTTLLDSQPVTGESDYFTNEDDPNEWVVVMSRPLPAKGDYEVSFRREDVPAAFAVWQGSEAERDGLKRVSDGWVMLDFQED